MPVLILSVLSYPYVDTVRVMIIRKKNEKKFFEPDKNHIHHKLIESNMSHVKSTILILSILILKLRL